MANEIDSKGLLWYQVNPAIQLLAALRRNGAALDASDMGVGKTYTAGAVLRALDEPTLVVCPRVSVSAWERMGKHLGVSFDIKHYEALRGGNSPYGWWQNPMPKDRPRIWKCKRCQRQWVDEKDAGHCPYPLPNGQPHNEENEDVTSAPPPHKYGPFHWHPGIRTVVFDEVHRCSAVDSLQARMLIASKVQRQRILMLSATVAESPMNLRAIGFALGLHNLVDRRDGSGGPIGFYQWILRNGCYKLPMKGFQFAVGKEKRDEILKSLHAQIFPERGARIRIDDLGDSFPEVQVTAELYDTEEANRIQKLYEKMAAQVEKINALREPDALAITELLRDRQEIEMLMLPVFVELCRDANAEGRHVALFFNFRETVEEACRMLKTSCRVDGSQVGAAGERRRNECVDAFQRDEEENIVCSVDAGCESISLHDLRGIYPRLGLVSLGWSAKKARQLFGRLRRALGKSKAIYRCVLAANTVQERVYHALVGKLDRLDLINDGDLRADVPNLPLTKFVDM